MLASIRRPTFEDRNLSTGKRVRLYNMMYGHGPGNGTLMLLPIDQGLEHGPIDFFDNPIWDSVRLRVQEKGADIRRQGFFGIAMASQEEQAYTGLKERDQELDARFATRADKALSTPRA